MSKYIAIFILLTSCTISCKTMQAYRIEEGKFIRADKYSFLGSDRIDIHELILNQDSTFSFKYSGPAGSNKCQGKCYYLDNKTILLKCNDEEYYLISQDNSKVPLDPAWMSGYMRDRERKVKIVNENKIKLEIPGVKKYIVLKRVVE